jgi:hypothetical protein
MMAKGQSIGCYDVLRKETSRVYYPSFNNQKLAPKEKLAAISIGPIRVPKLRNSTKALIYAGKVIIQNICVHICTITIKDCHYSPVTSVLLIVRIDLRIFT